MRSSRLIFAVLAIAACRGRSSPPPATAVAPDAAVPVFRTDGSTDHTEAAYGGKADAAMVVSESPIASQVGHDILAAGGNAADAAVATAFALAVVYPPAGNLGGGGFAMVRVAAGDERALDFREVAPAAATVDMYLDADGNPTDASQHGHLAVGVPGSVAGLWALHERVGELDWKALVAPAITLARDGFVIDERLHSAIVAGEKTLRADPAAAALWLPGGTPRATGERVQIPALAATLERIRDGGAAGFYAGATAAAIVAEMHGAGIVTAEDLARYQPAWRAPLRFTYRGRTIVAMPPPSSGGVALAMIAGMLERTDVAALGWHSAAHVHLLAEVWRRAFAARNELLGDPAFLPGQPIAELTSPRTLDRLVASIGPNATPSSEVGALVEGDHTTNLCVVDRAGLAVVMTTTLNGWWGSGVMVDGFLLNNEMDDFTVKPGSPNAFGLVQGTSNRIEPGKRMLSSMSPTIVERANGDVELLVGAAGGPRIITAVWQTISNVIDFGESVDAAIARPRVHHQHLPDRLYAEADSLTAETAAALEAEGYVLDHGWAPRTFGAVNAIVRTSTGWQGAADPRGGGAAR